MNSDILNCELIVRDFFFEGVGPRGYQCQEPSVEEDAGREAYYIVEPEAGSTHSVATGKGSTLGHEHHSEDQGDNEGEEARVVEHPAAPQF